VEPSKARVLPLVATMVAMALVAGIEFPRIIECFKQILQGQSDW
jgi:hypothetical protein